MTPAVLDDPDVVEKLAAALLAEAGRQKARTEELEVERSVLLSRTESLEAFLHEGEPLRKPALSSWLQGV